MANFPKVSHVYALLKQIVDPAKNVLEVGCGYGRLCRAFVPQCYIGVDINPKAIEAARQKNPGYKFDLINPAAAFAPG